MLGENLRVVESEFGRLMIVGDLHLSDSYSGRHVDYFANCLDILKKISAAIELEKPTHLVFSGDLIGITLREKHLKTRDALLLVMHQFILWNSKLNGNVYCVQGNHDISENTTDYDILKSLNLVKTPKYFDIGVDIRCHLINYGDARQPIEILQDAYNVAVMHENLQVYGETNWFRGGKDDIELKTLDNLEGIDFIACGHIHNPSIKMVTSVIGQREVKLFYMGSPTRPTYDENIWTKAYGLLFDVNENHDVSIATHVFELSPKEELFKETLENILEELVNEQNESEPTYTAEELSDILKGMQFFNLTGAGEYKEQIMRYAGLDKEPAEVAIKYFEIIESELK